MENLEKTTYDLVIVGTGPAGLTASIYASRYKIKTLALGSFPGGLVNEAHRICNFPSEADISGAELADKFFKNAISQGGEIKNEEVLDVRKDGEIFLVSTKKNTYSARSVLLSFGMKHRKLGLDREYDFLGKGISYCATCDGMFSKGKVVAVVGGNDSALTAALYLAEIAEKVYLVHRGKEFRGERVWIDKVLEHKNIEVMFETNVKEFLGDKKLEGVRLDKSRNGSDELPAKGLFVEIGSEPDYKEYIAALGIKLTKNNFIEVAQDQKTSAPGIWAAGDITNASNGFRQIITACSEGAIAAEDISKNLR